jgi:hypothetical protein
MRRLTVPVVGATRIRELSLSSMEPILLHAIVGALAQGLRARRWSARRRAGFELGHLVREVAQRDIAVLGDEVGDLGAGA